jgi:hypothetical protein
MYNTLDDEQAEGDDIEPDEAPPAPQTREEILDWIRGGLDEGERRLMSWLSEEALDVIVCDFEPGSNPLQDPYLPDWADSIDPTHRHEFEEVAAR